MQPELEDDEADRDDDRDRRAERRAGRGPEHVRVGERVAQQPLEGRPGDGQRAADEHRGQDPRQAQVDDDRLGRRRTRSSGCRARGTDGRGSRSVSPGSMATLPTPTPRTSATTSATTPRPTSRTGRSRRPADRPTRGRAVVRASPRVVIGGSRHGRDRRGRRQRRGPGGWPCASSRRPSTRRGPGRVTIRSLTGRIAPFLTAVMTVPAGACLDLVGGHAVRARRRAG